MRLPFTPPVRARELLYLAFEPLAFTEECLRRGQNMGKRTGFACSAVHSAIVARGGRVTGRCVEHVMPDMTTDATRRRTPYSPWPLDELVRAQCMACEGRSLDSIAQALGRTAEEVRRRLDPEPAAGRPEFASVGYRHLKCR